MRTHLSWSSGLDGMPLTFDAFRECSVLGLVCLDKWVRISALHMIELWLGLHTQTPGPDRFGIRAGLSVGLSNPWPRQGAPGAPLAAFWSHFWLLAPSGAWIFWYFFGIFLRRPKIHFPAHNKTIQTAMLKTALVQVSFIQIMQEWGQNSSKSVWKSRYILDVSRSYRDIWQSHMPRISNMISQHYIYKDTTSHIIGIQLP